VLVLALCAWAIWSAVRSGKPVGATERRRARARARDRLFDRLVHLEKERAAERIAGDRYHRERGALVAKLALLHRELDELESAQ
jgi:hypothetical protein